MTKIAKRIEALSLLHELRQEGETTGDVFLRGLRALKSLPEIERVRDEWYAEYTQVRDTLSDSSTQPVAWLHTMHMEFEQKQHRLAFSDSNAFGRPGIDYDRSYQVTIVPLYASPPTPVLGEAFQPRVLPWMLECFGPTIPFDKTERNHRFLEEALELVQACECTQDEAHQLVDYVYGRDQGDINQEVGGVMVTLAALCIANGFDMHGAGETELARIWTKVPQIRAKQAGKPKHSPLPGSVRNTSISRVG